MTRPARRTDDRWNMADYFIARQPILNAALDVYAYELLFRTSDSGNAPEDLDNDRATADVLTTTEEVGLARIAGGHPAFINVPERFLTDPDLLPDPQENVVLEVLENVALSPAVVAGISTLAERGYTLALDDFVYDARFESVLPYTSIVKLEIPRIAPADWEVNVRRLQDRGITVLAEKVETADEFDRLAALGCDLFQGYFFARPRVVSGKRLAPSQLGMLELLSQINNPDVDLDQLSELVSRDMALSMRALKHVNSAASALSRRIESVHEAVVYLGREAIKRLVTLLLMAGVDDKPGELVTMALTRARFMQLYATAGQRSDADSYFTVGLLSLLDTLMDMPMDAVLKSMSLSQELQGALQQHSGTKGEALALASRLERGITVPERGNSIPSSLIADLHNQALSWADDTLGGVAAPS